MSSGGATTKGVSVKGTSHTSVNSSSNHKKSSKSDSKSDKLDLTPKLQPTAEQIQIARIMDSHRNEDPDVQKKIRQVMEITRTTEDQASMALHSREYDIEQAITLLTEGGSDSLESEWAQAGKKRKPKNQNQKADNGISKDGALKDGGDRMGRDKSEKRDSRGGEKKDLDGDQQFPSGDQRRGGADRDRGGRGTGRGGGRGRPGAGRGGRMDKENDEIKSGRMQNGPGRSRGGGGGFGRGSRGGGRTFASRARGGEREGDNYHPIDVWENSQADGTREAPLKVDKWDEFPAAEDWDNEEYQGSLADTKVFTPSTQTTGPLSDTTNGGGGAGPPSNHIQSASNNTAADIVKMSINQEAGVTMSSVVQGLNGPSGGGPMVVSGQSIDLSLLLQKSQQNSSQSHGNAGANLLASLQSSYANSAQGPVGGSNQALPQRNKIQRPRGPTSKIPSSAVEMPDNSVTPLDVSFGILDLSSDPSSHVFDPVMQMQGLKSTGGGDSMLYSQSTKMESFASAAAAGEKEIKASSFQNQINNQSQGSLNIAASERSKASSNISSAGIDSLSSLSNQQPKNQQAGSGSYGVGAAVNAGNSTGSAFAPYGKGAPGFPAPGFPPVSQNPAAGTYSNSNTAPVAGVPQNYGSLPIANQTAQSAAGYHMGNLVYGSQPTNIPQSQPIASQSQTGNVPYGTGVAAQPHNSYLNSNTSYSNNSAAQYGGYVPKMSGSNASSGGSGKESAADINTSAPVSGPSVSAAQMGSGSVMPASSSSSNTKISTSSNATANPASKMNSNTAGMPPGMMMPPQYIVNQGAPQYYSLQTPMYGYDDNSLQFVHRYPTNMTGYYEAGAVSYVPGAPGVTQRTDGAAMQGYSTGADARFQRSDNSSTASPVPSNLAGGSAQQPMYNTAAMPFYYVGNNMVPPGAHFAPYGPPTMYQAPMATATNASGPPANHQYQNKGVYNPTQYTYDTSQGGPVSDFGKTYGTGPSGVGPNTGAGKGATGSTPGVSQSTELNSSMYAKGHMAKINNYDNKGYSATGPGVYNSLGGGQGNQLGNTGMATPYNVIPYNIAQQPVQALPLHQDAGNTSRQGPGQAKGNKQQQYNAGPYWGNN